MKNHWQSPIGGWKHVEPATGAQLENWAFDVLVAQIIAHRQANKRFNLPTDSATVANELDLENANRMLSIRGGDQYIIQDGGGGGVPFTPPPRRSRVAAVVAGAGKLGQGVSILADWLGDGAQTVAPELANARAAICAKCPLNNAGDWTTWFSAPAASFIKTQLEHRKQMKLSTPDDARISMCQACGCQLHLAVHVPISYKLSKLSKLSAEAKAKLDPGCWILSEEKTLGK